jgi:hypothetical protein
MARGFTRSSSASSACAAAALLAAITASGAPAPALASDAAHGLQFQLDSAAQAEFQQDVELVIVKPDSPVTHLGAVPLKVQLVYGPQPSRVIFAFEQLQVGGWQALGTFETGWSLLPQVVPPNFLQATGRYRVRVSPGSDSTARRVVTPVERDWSAWREFSFKLGNSVPGGAAAPAVKMPSAVLQ